MAFISYLPASVCLFWFVTNSLLSRRTGSSGIIQILLAVLGVLFFTSADIALTVTTDGSTLAMFFIRQMAALMVIPLSAAYLKQLTAADRPLTGFFIWAAVPVSILFAELVLVMLIGVPDCIGFVDLLKRRASIASMTSREMQIMYICCVYVFYVAVFLTIAFLLIPMPAIVRKDKSGGSIWNFLFNGGKSSVLRLQCSGLVFLALLFLALILFQDNGVCCFRGQSALYMLLAATVYAVSYIGLFQERGDICVRDLVSKSGTRDSAPIQSNSPGMQAAVARQDTALAAKVSVSRKAVSMPGNRTAASPDFTEDEAEYEYETLDPEEENRLRMKFEDLMLSEQPFLRQGIKVADVAAMLDTNRTYISRLVNSTYGMTFSDYVNRLRIDYAKQYLLDNRNARQSDIAAASGFPNAPSFNSIFKKATGMTPRIWLATHTQEQEQEQEQERNIIQQQYDNEQHS